MHKALKRRIEELETIKSDLEHKLDRAMRLLQRAIEQKTKESIDREDESEEGSRHVCERDSCEQIAFE